MNKAIGNQPKTAGTPDLASRSDEDLLLAYRDRADRAAFPELVRRYERELYSYLRRYLGDAEMAEDTFQATFLQVHLKCDQFETGRKFRPWLYTVATNQAIDAQRRNKRHRNVSLDRNMRQENGDELGSLMDLLVSREPHPEARADSAQQTARSAPRGGQPGVLPGAQVSRSGHYFEDSRRHGEKPVALGDFETERSLAEWPGALTQLAVCSCEKI
jgi:RNA polymerase sigma factor (sigma-70 family)